MDARNSYHSRTGSRLQIANIQTFVVDCYRTNWVFVKVIADDGSYGYGEASIEGQERSVVAAIEELGRIVLGKDPFDIEQLHLLMQRDSYWRSGPILSTAISGIEIALWDLKGKILRLPVYQLLGGKVRDAVPVYANSWFAGATTNEEFRDLAIATVESGFTGLKWDPFGQAHLSVDTTQMNAIEANVAAVRDAVGPDIDLMIEGHGRLDVTSAIQIGRRLEDFNIRWFEEPIAPDRASSLARVRKAVRSPIAAGERCYSRFNCADLIDAEAVDVLQPDACHIGGLTEMKRVAALADAAHLPVAPHNPYGPICHAATLHFALSCPNFTILETFISDVPWRREITIGEWTFSNGSFHVPETPGLGFDLDETAFERHPYQPHALRHYTGALTDIRPARSERWF